MRPATAKPNRPNYWTEFSDLLPRKWHRIGHPIPVPGGHVFIVTVPVRGRRVHVLNRYVADTRTFVPVLDDMGRAILLDDPQVARRTLTERAHHIEATED